MQPCLGDRIEVEASIGSLRPDLIMHRADERIAVEIYVSHKCDDEKVSALCSMGVDAVEIDMSRHMRGVFDDGIQADVFNECRPALAQ